MLNLPKKLELETLKSIQSEDGFSNDRIFPEKMIRVFDPTENKTWGYLVIDDIRSGPGLGGVRLAKDVTLKEVIRLAHTMTMKNSAANLPFGGGKVGLMIDPETANEQPNFKTKFLTLFAEALFPVTSYIPAPDMGTNEQDMQVIYEFFSQKYGNYKHMRGGAGRPLEKGGIPIDKWALTAHGLFAAAKTLEGIENNWKIKGSKIVIQGYGNVGSPIATKLFQAGANIVGASDIHIGLWSPNGLNVVEMNNARDKAGGLTNYSGCVEKYFSSGNLDRLLEAPCDILIPAARPDAITSRNADRVDCRYILQGANTPSNKMTEYYLQNRRNILSMSDFIVNVGGVIGCAVELTMNTDELYKAKVLEIGVRAYLEKLIYDTVSSNVLEIYQRLKMKRRSDSIFREEGLILAEERLKETKKDYWI